MTILHKFSQRANDIANLISQYFVTLDSKSLADANEILREQIAEFQSEAKAPSIQDTMVTFRRLTGAQLESELQSENALSLQNEDYIADGPIEKGKLIRIQTVDQEEGSVGLMKVTLVTEQFLILAPVIADPLQNDYSNS